MRLLPVLAVAFVALAGPLENAKADNGPSPSIACVGDGHSGRRVQVLNVRLEGRPDRSSEVIPQLRAAAEETDAVFDESAAYTGGTRRVRWVTDPSCLLEVLVETIPPASSGNDRSLSYLAEQLRLKGYTDPLRKYVVAFDQFDGCGKAELRYDSSPGGSNLNNGAPSVPGLFAVLDSTNCIGSMPHELMHTLGAVQPAAPNSDGGTHCIDGWDRMCHAGEGLGVGTCEEAFQRLFDCGHDDYYSISTQPGSWLASHWNTADSGFLIRSGISVSRPWNVTLACIGGMYHVSWSDPVVAASPPVEYVITVGGTEIAVVSGDVRFVDLAPALLIDASVSDISVYTSYDGGTSPLSLHARRVGEVASCLAQVEVPIVSGKVTLLLVVGAAAALGIIAARSLARTHSPRARQQLS